MNRLYFETISDYFKAAGKPQPEHPLFAICPIKAGKITSFGAETIVSTGFYAIGLKKVIAGEMIYGRTKYDFQSGTMVFFAPNHPITSYGMEVESEGVVIFFHKDFIRGTYVEDLVNESSFFDYAVNEALHLSEKEEGLLHSIFESITHESDNNYDEFSRDIIHSHIASILKYSKRFYRRQFIVRNETDGALYKKFSQLVEAHLRSTEHSDLPQISDIASSLNVTQRYLTDALKVETGKSAKEWIQLITLKQAKARLLESNDSVASIAYSLGYEYPQYFARLFKKKMGQTPTEYRNMH